MPTLHILHTNDLHNALTPQKAHFIRDLRQHFMPDALLLDAGDAVKAGNLGANSRELILRLLDDAGYDAMAMGNRESHPTRAALTKKLQDARVPILAANLRARQDKPAPRVVEEYLEFGFGPEEDEVIVTVIGLAPQITAPDSFWARVTDYVFDDPVKTGRGLAKKLRPETDLLIALTHIGYERDIELAGAPDIDLIIGGHSHRAVMPPERHGHAWIAATAANATHIGHLTVTFDDEGITAITGELIPLP